MLALARGARMRSVAAVAVTAIAVARADRGGTPRSGSMPKPHRDYAVLERPSGTRRRGARAGRARRRASASSNGERPRVEVIGLGGPWQNLAMVRSLEAINGYNPLRIGIYDRLVSPGEGELAAGAARFPGVVRRLRLRARPHARPRIRACSAARSRRCRISRGGRSPTCCSAGPDVWVYRLKDPAPRLKFSRRVQVADADAVSGAGLAADEPVARPRADRRRHAAVASYAGRGVGAGSARIASWRPDRIEIDVDSELGGMLALHETWYPGWIAEIDGMRVPILRADVLFRGVEVPAGRHRVVFRFAPFSLDNLATRCGARCADAPNA